MDVYQVLWLSGSVVVLIIIFLVFKIIEYEKHKKEARIAYQRLIQHVRELANKAND